MQNPIQEVGGFRKWVGGTRAVQREIDAQILPKGTK